MLLNPTKCYSVARLAVMADNIFFFFLDFQSTKEPESWARFLFFWGGGGKVSIPVLPTWLSIPLGDMVMLLNLFSELGGEQTC